MREQIRANRQNHLLSENEAEANVLHFLYTQDVKEGGWYPLRVR